MATEKKSNFPVQVTWAREAWAAHLVEHPEANVLYANFSFVADWLESWSQRTHGVSWAKFNRVEGAE